VHGDIITIHPARYHRKDRDPTDHGREATRRRGELSVGTSHTCSQRGGRGTSSNAASADQQTDVRIIVSNQFLFLVFRDNKHTHELMHDASSPRTKSTEAIPCPAAGGGRTGERIRTTTRFTTTTHTTAPTVVGARWFTVLVVRS